MSPDLNLAAVSLRHRATSTIDPMPSAMTDAVLLSVMLAGTCRTPPDLAAGLLERFGSVGAVLSADAGELRRAGAGERHVRVLKCLQEAAIRAAQEDACQRPAISSWSQLIAYVRIAIASLPREQFRTLYLDRRNGLIREEWVADGTHDHAPVYVDSVIACFLALAAGRTVTNARQCHARETRL